MAYHLYLHLLKYYPDTDLARTMGQEQYHLLWQLKWGCKKTGGHFLNMLSIRAQKQGLVVISVQPEKDLKVQKVNANFKKKITPLMSRRSDG